MKIIKINWIINNYMGSFYPMVHNFFLSQNFYFGRFYD